jgi:hexosaminidase
MKKTIISIGTAILMLWQLKATAQVSIIPQPMQVSVASSNDSFLLSAETKVIATDAALQPSADFLNDYLQTVYGFSLKKSKPVKETKSILLRQQQMNKPAIGAYTLNVNKDGVTIEGGEETGVFYGIQSLIQLLPIADESAQNKNSILAIPYISIVDRPRFSYRGMMLDVGRHMFPVAFIKKYINYLALHKINYFHWHLTEDQGWRVEIKKYPKLTTIGSFRNGTITDHYPGTGNDNMPYGGFYTQQEIKDVVAYAAKRYITVIPEIEMPGHSSAAIASYPWLSCFPEQPTVMKKSPTSTAGYKRVKKVQETWGVHEDVYCAGNDSTFIFLQDVLDEVTALFPSPYIHIGGDESPKTNWKKCAKCQARIKQENLADEHALQSYFIQRMEKYLNRKGKTIIGWDEILEGGLAPNAVVMSWRGEKGGIEAARQRHEVILTPNSHLYFDQYQDKSSEEPLAIGGYNPLSKVYAYNPVPKELKPDEIQYIKGVQANLWTEYIKTPQHVEYMVLPRIAALSEMAWSQSEQKNWDSFRKRMEKQYLRYEAININFSKAAYSVQQTILIESVLTRATVTMASDSYDTQIFYTVDGTEPTSSSSLYTKPFMIRQSAVIKAATFKNGKKMGKTSEQEIVLKTRQ